MCAIIRCCASFCWKAKPNCCSAVGIGFILTLLVEESL
jgi:hypothetical protein